MIVIKESLCIGCRQCQRVCPAGVFEFSEGCMRVADETYCIACAQCLAACPAGAIEHGLCLGTQAKVFRKEDLPDPDSVMLLLQSRRSVRDFSSEAVPAGKLRRIIEAANAAPTAQNKRELRFIVITDPEKIAEISRHTVDIFYKVVRLLDNAFLRPFVRTFLPEAYSMIPRFEKMHKALYREDRDPVLHRASAVLFVAAPDSSRFGAADANLAYQNASLMAASLGVSHFYTGYVLAALSRDKKKKIARLLSLKNYKIQAGMAMGMSTLEFKQYIDRKMQEVIEI